MSDTPLGEGWWIADDDRWYAPELHPDYQPPVAQPAPEPAPPPQPAPPPDPPPAVSPPVVIPPLSADHLPAKPVYVAPTVANTDDLVVHHEHHEAAAEPSKPGRSLVSRAIYAAILAIFVGGAGYIGSGADVESNKRSAEDCEADRRSLADLIESNKSPSGGYIDIEVMRAFGLTGKTFPDHVMTLHGDSGEADEYRIVEIEDCRTVLSVSECDQLNEDVRREQNTVRDAFVRADASDDPNDSWADYFDGAPKYNVVRSEFGALAGIELDAGLPLDFLTGLGSVQIDQDGETGNC